MTGVAIYYVAVTMQLYTWFHENKICITAQSIG